MGDQKNQSTGYGSEQGRKDEEQTNQYERASQRSDKDQGKGSGGQSGDRDRASNPQGGSNTERNQQPKPGQPNPQNVDR